MSGRHRVPAPVAVIFGIVITLYGLVIQYLNLSSYFKNSQFIGQADKVVAECTAAGDGTQNNTYGLKSTVAFTYNGKRYENVVIDDFGQCIIPGESVDLYVNPNNPYQCQVEYKFTEGTAHTYTMLLILIPVGVLMIVVGVSRIRKGNMW